jgi:hypothetical protein
MRPGSANPFGTGSEALVSGHGLDRVRGLVHPRQQAPGERGRCPRKPRHPGLQVDAFCPDIDIASRSRAHGAEQRKRCSEASMGFH